MGRLYRLVMMLCSVNRHGESVRRHISCWQVNTRWDSCIVLDEDYEFFC